MVQGNILLVIRMSNNVALKEKSINTKLKNDKQQLRM